MLPHLQMREGSSSKKESLCLMSYVKRQVGIEAGRNGSVSIPTPLSVLVGTWHSAGLDTLKVAWLHFF